MAIEREWEDQISYKSIAKVFTYGVNTKNIVDDTNSFVNATEWGNGEGLDLSIMKHGKDEIIVPLTHEEAYAILHVLELMFDVERRDKEYYEKQCMLQRMRGKYANDR